MLRDGLCGLACQPFFISFSVAFCLQSFCVLPAPFLALFTHTAHSEMLPVVYKWRKIWLLLELWQASKQTAGILPTMMDKTRESSKVQFSHFSCNVFICFCSILHGHVSNTTDIYYYILNTIFLFNQTTQVLLYVFDSLTRANSFTNQSNLHCSYLLYIEFYRLLYYILQQ